MYPDYERLVLAQEALRAPFDFAAPERWVRAATAAVRDVAACDHTLFFLPFPQPNGPAGRIPFVWSSDTDPAVPSAYEAAFRGVHSGHDEWTDPLLSKTRGVRRRAGGGVFHERDLSSREVVERSAFYQEVLHPHGVRHLMGIAVSGPDNQEYAVVVAYERDDAPGFCEDTLLRLRLLYPAFEGGVRTCTRLHDEMAAREASFTSTVDALDLPALLTDSEGRETHRNDALLRLLATEPEARRVLAAARARARALFQPPHQSAGKPSPSGALPHTVHTQRRDYRLGGVRLGPTLLGREGALITVERTGLPLPDMAALSERFGLTPREAEVALHLARGRTDRQVAAALTISYSTARRHAERTLQKLDVRSRAAVAFRVCEPPGERTHRS